VESNRIFGAETLVGGAPATVLAAVFDGGGGVQNGVLSAAGGGAGTGGGDCKANAAVPARHVESAETTNLYLADMLIITFKLLEYPIVHLLGKANKLDIQGQLTGEASQVLA